MHNMDVGQAMLMITTDCHWTLYKIPSSESLTLPDLSNSLAQWASVPVPGTVAQAIGENAALAENLDDYDWCYCADFNRADLKVLAQINAAGLATHAEIWLNGKCVLHSDNMFLHHVLDLTEHLEEKNSLWLVFRSLNRVLAEKRPRPRWKTNLIDNQQLRWVRTTLLGRIPGWTPPIKPIGPWGVFALESSDLLVSEINVKASLPASVTGCIDVNARLTSAVDPKNIAVSLHINQQTFALNVQSQTDSSELIIAEQITINNPTLWWPHTHGESYLYDYELTATVNGKTHIIRCGKLGFREIHVSREQGGVSLRVNGVEVFCRGACWTTPDLLSLSADKAGYLSLLTPARDAGANMLRVGGTMVYEQDDFYQTCDELGLLVWQDMMFANMDYPFDDDVFAASVNREIQQQITRLSQYTSVVIYCGGSEVQQQAAMFGLPPEFWKSEFFDATLANAVNRIDAHAGYFPSSPCEGALPFHNNQGIAHYFGVGAYQRDFSDLAIADVKFAAECLAFANFPAESSRKHFFGSPNPQPHHPKWKAGVCRDNGAGWDFADVTDFYLEKIFHLNAYQLRYENLERYHQLSEFVTGYVMARSYYYWRSSQSHCGGGIIWFYNDIAPGAGWGLIDKAGQEKPALQIVKQAWQPVQIVLIDNGLNGIALEVVNETADEFTGNCTVNLIRTDGDVAKTAEVTLTVKARGRAVYSVDQLLGGFNDTTHSYRFGPAQHGVAVAHLRDGDDEFVSQATIVQQPLTELSGSALDVQAQLIEMNGGFYLSVQTNRLLLGANFSIKNVNCALNYIDLIPGKRYLIPVSGVEAGGKYRSSLTAINGSTTFTLSTPVSTII